MISERLKQLRKELNKNQTDIAKLIGVASTTYASWEQGKREPDIDTINRLATLFNVTTDYLLGRNQTPRDATAEETKALEKILHEDAGLTFTDEPITPEDRAAIESMITSYFWSKGRNRIKYMDDNKE